MASYRGLSALGNMGSWNVSATDIGAGALVGLGGVGLAKWANNQFLATVLPDAVKRFLPVLGSAVIGGVAYVAQKGNARAKGHLIGALAVGVGIQAWDLLKANFPQLGNPYSYTLPSQSYSGLGLLQHEPAQLNSYNGMGLIVDEPGQMGRLAQMSMDDEADAAP